MAEPTITVRRVYDPEDPAEPDGLRVLVDRLWPRGITKADAHLDDWPKVLTPSTALRREWHAGNLADEVFRRRYRDELDAEEARAARADLLARAGDGRLTLLTAVRDPAHSHVPVLTDFLREDR
ncbi:DUF488 family protein [Streptomyces sp. SID3343]|uniref:DUF488 domain-containing protein n=1 Tax=Streptomyces sp. SID3343 TaxID=2690260 RepID=UPI0013694E21|nr:DUF488 family protein [Streptomyces sp. SID3343]MYW04897.1 DUF488 family protein [Streptomyces sp. SID3343]